MPKKYDLPAMPFYVGDWLKCPEVRALTPEYRGLWFDLICFMWESTERGVMVKPNSKPYSDADIVRMVGLDNQNSGIWLTHLLDNEVCSRRADGAIYSKRMVKDEKLRVLRREIGKKGGNPSLLVNHTHNLEVNQNIENANANANVNDNVIKEKGTPKTKHLDSVFLSQDELLKLEKLYGMEGAKTWIEKLNIGIMAKGYKYKSHYHAILSWDRRDKKLNAPKPVNRKTGWTPEEWAAAEKAKDEKYLAGKAKA